MTAKYWIAQYVGDVFRNEPRNIGVFVDKDGDRAFRFFGADEKAELDGRKTRNAFQYPDVYKQWVDFWTGEITGPNLESLVKSSGENFRVREGGEVSDTGNDSSAAVAEYLYKMLVSAGGWADAMGAAEDEEPARTKLATEVSAILTSQSLLGEAEKLPVAHPVRRSVPVMGRAVAQHVPAFVQENGRLYVMETVDFTTKHKTSARDHAGWSAYMFTDIRNAKAHSGGMVHAISIVRLEEADRDLEEVSNGLASLRNESDVVNWLDQKQRADFLEDRRRVAVS